MTYSKPLADREKALEDAFFRKESDRLLAEMRARETRQARFEALSKVLGLRDASIIDPLLDFGLREENVTALVMAPLVAVAWADRNLDNEERGYLLKAETDLGIDPESEAGRLLAVWLDHRPHAHLLDAWAAYVSELCRVLPAEERTRLREDIVSWTWKIARALEKSFLRAGTPTRAERAVIERVEAAFDVDGTEHVTTGVATSGVTGLDDIVSSMT